MKPPAFQFYADDFLSGTADMTAEEVGVYIRLLCHAWSKDGLEDNEARLSLLAGQCHGNAIAYAKSKFVLIDGKLRNPRQERERQKQADFRQKQAENAKSRWVGYAKPMPPHMPNVCSPVSSLQSPIIDAKHTQGSFPKLADVVTKGEFIGMAKSDCEKFWHHYESMGWVDKNGNPIKRWESKLMVWKAQEAGKTAPNASTGANSGNVIIQGKEYERILERIKTLKATYGDHQSWAEADLKEFRTLKKRRDELKGILGITL